MKSDSAVSGTIRELGVHGLVFAIASIAQSAASFIVLPILANHLSTNDFGVFSLLQMVIAFGQAVFYFGISSALPRSYFDYDDPESRAAVFSTAFYLTLVGVAALGVFTFAFSTIIAERLLENSGSEFLVDLAAGTAAAIIMNQIFLVQLRIKKRSAVVAAVSVFNLFSYLTLVAFFVVQFSAGITGALIAGLISQSMACALLAWSCRDDFRLRMLKSEIKLQLVFGFSTVIISFATIALDWGDRLLIKKFLSLGDVGTYSLAYRMASVVNILIIVPMTQIWNPVMMEHRNSPNAKTLFQKVFELYTALGAVTVILFSVLFDEVLRLILVKPEFDQALTILPVVMFGIFIYGYTNITSAGLFYSRYLRPMILVYYTAALIRFGLNYLLLPSFGYIGAAWAALLSYSLIPVSVHIFARKYFPVSYPAMKLSWIFALSLVTATALVRFHDGEPILRISLKFAIAVLVTAAILRWGLSVEERSLIRNFLTNLRARLLPGRSA